MQFNSFVCEVFPQWKTRLKQKNHNKLCKSHNVKLIIVGNDQMEHNRKKTAVTEAPLVIVPWSNLLKDP